MKSKYITPRFLLLTVIILIAAACRLLPHPPNFTPIAAIALFGGAYFGNKITAFAVAFIAMFLSDLAIGFHNIMGAVYISFGIIVMIGFFLRNNKGVLPVAFATVASAVIFFLITNFAVWMGSSTFSQDLSGLIACYAVAIPFFQNTLAGNLLFTTVLFGGFYLVQLKFPVLAKV